MNLLLVITFVGLSLVLFAGLLLASRPSKQQKKVQTRLGQLGLGDKVEEQTRQVEDLLKQSDDAAFPWFDQLLSRLGLYESLKTLIEQADSQSSPAKVASISLCLALVGFITVSLFLSVLAIQALAAVILAVAPVLVLQVQRSRRIKAFNDALPDAMDLMARALRAGHSVASAIEVIAERGRKPVSSEFALVYQQQNFGLPFRDALTNMAERIPSKDLQFVVTAMLVQKETGGNLAEILDRTTHVLRERIRIFGEVRIKSAQGRLTGWILSLLPLGLGVLINIVNHGFEKPLFEEQIGRVMLYAGAGMLATGGFIISKIVKIEV
jgi:tight adherence protein B